MYCTKHRHYLANGSICERAEISAENEEVALIANALAYYTEKRGLTFEKRMLAGDLARQIAKGEWEEIHDEA